MGDKNLSSQFLVQNIWVSGYFVASSENITNDVIIKYIEDQGKESHDTI